MLTQMWSSKYNKLKEYGMTTNIKKPKNILLPLGQRLNRVDCFYYLRSSLCLNLDPEAEIKTEAEAELGSRIEQARDGFNHFRTCFATNIR